MSRSTCQYCKKKRYQKVMVVINRKSEKNGKPEWACKNCVPGETLQLISEAEDNCPDEVGSVRAERVLIHNQPYLIGCEDLKLESLDWLNPGDEIQTIGELTKNGKQSSSCRFLECPSGTTFAGTYALHDGDETKSCALFVVPKDQIKGRELNEPLYKLFYFNSGEFVIPEFEQGTIKIYHSVINGKPVDLTKIEDFAPKSNSIYSKFDETADAAAFDFVIDEMQQIGDDTRSLKTDRKLAKERFEKSIESKKAAKDTNIHANFICEICNNLLATHSDFFSTSMVCQGCQSDLSIKVNGSIERCNSFLRIAEMHLEHAKPSRYSIYRNRESDRLKHERNCQARVNFYRAELMKITATSNI